MNNSNISSRFEEQWLVFRKVRSFVKRKGRLTKRQKRALDKFWQLMGTNYQNHLLDLTALLGNTAPITLEIGFGMGCSLVSLAAAHPEQNFIGIEVYLPGVGSCLANAEEAGVKNLRVICHDAVEVLEKMIPDTSLKLVQLFFPDPWHKTRHNKRRIVQTPFVELVGRKLTENSIFHMATDWQPYAEHMLKVMSNSQFFHNLSSTGDYIPRPENRFLTKFEERGQRLGHGVWDLMFVKKDLRHT